MTRPPRQQIHASNISRDIDEGLEARIADPLWFLARQWQMGEFEAEDGGRPMRVEVEARLHAVETLHAGGRTVRVTPSRPLESQVEAEGPEGIPAAWNPARLSYRFALRTGAHLLEADDYDGRALDWHDFRLSQGGSAEGEEQRFQMVPGQLQIDGVPEPRFWTVEEAGSAFDSGTAAEPNILSVLLPEFFYTDIRNWHVLPAPMPAGHLREVRSVAVVDSFGIVTMAEPVGRRDRDDGFSVFAPDRAGAAPADASVLLCLNTAARLGQNDLLEEVRFLRDEGANLVWAWERQFTDASGALVETALEPAPEGRDAPATGLRFRLMSQTARAFVPYVPRQTAGNAAVDGAIALRRARTSEAYGAENPQYRGRIVAESRHLDEEGIPRTGLRVRRLNRFARGTDGEVHFWVGRDVDVAEHGRKPRLVFDEITGKPGPDPDAG